jgi:hypothetical protein
MFYAKSTHGFYDISINGSDIPDDAVQITVDQHDELLAAQCSGKVIQADVNGYPVALDPLPPPFASIKYSALESTQESCLPAINALTGIAGRAARSNDMATAMAADTAATSLIGLITYSTVMAATDGVSLKAAIVARFNVIALTAKSFPTVFAALKGVEL